MNYQTENCVTRSRILELLTGVLFVTACAVSVNAAEPFELMTHDTFVAGKDDVDAGAYDEGIAKLEKRLNRALPNSIKTPILIDLCVAHTMQRNIAQATEYCDRAMESGWYSGLAYNNRGVLQIAKGNYEQAIRDFERAIKGMGADAIAKRNLSRAQTRLAAIQEEQRLGDTAVAAVFDPQSRQ